MGQHMAIGSRTILIVDDEPLLRFDLVDFFEQAGWQVFDAGTADAAIALLDAHPQIRVVLTDVQMPGTMNGLKLAHHIRERFPPTALFVVSGHIPVAERDLPARAIFLPKPFDPHRLLRQIEAIAP